MDYVKVIEILDKLKTECTIEELKEIRKCISKTINKKIDESIRNARNE